MKLHNFSSMCTKAKKKTLSLRNRKLLLIQFVIFLTEIKTSPGFVLKGCKCVRNGLHKTGKGFSARKDLTRRVGKQKDCEFSWQLEACDEGQFNSFVKYLITKYLVD